jgi:membrane-associated protein
MHHLLTTFSEPIIYLVVFGIIFSETGILACFFFPGDTLLFSAGLFARQGLISLPLVIVVLIVAGFLGNLLGYYVGKIVRSKHRTSKLLQRIPEKHIARTEAFYAHYGALTVVLSRFVPIVRTVAPFLAGVSQMSVARFVTLSFVGGVLWAVLIPIAGFMFGRYITIDSVMYVSLGLMGLASIVTPIAIYLSGRYFKKH